MATTLCKNYPAQPATLTTIQNDRLLAICNHCAHTVELNKRQLIEKYGRGYEVPELKKHLRCTRCGSDSCAVQLALPVDGSMVHFPLVTLSRHCLGLI